MSELSEHLKLEMVRHSMESEEEARQKKSELASSAGSVLYVECRCYMCGWVDSFRADAIDENGEVDGYCDRCDRKRGFEKLHAPTFSRPMIGG